MLDSAVLSDSPSSCSSSDSSSDSACSEGERAMYYNLDADATLGDLTREEALRWDVLPLGAQNLGARGGEHVRTEHVEL